MLTLFFRWSITVRATLWQGVLKLVDTSNASERVGFLPESKLALGPREFAFPSPLSPPDHILSPLQRLLLDEIEHQRTSGRGDYNLVPAQTLSGQFSAVALGR
jgi:hypothetical protein